jgi:hypothetical protein
MAMGLMGCGRVSGKPGHETVIVKRPFGGKTSYETTLQNVESTGLYWAHAPYEAAGTIDPKPKIWKEQFSVTLQDDENIRFNGYLLVAIRPGKAKEIRDKYGDNWYESGLKRAFTERMRASTSTYTVFKVKANKQNIAEDVRQHLVEKYKESPFAILDVMIGTLEFKSENVRMAAVLAEEAKESKLQEDIRLDIQKADNEIAETKASGQAKVRDILQGTLTDEYNVYEGLMTLQELANSPNTRFYFVPFGQDGVSIIMNDSSAPGPARPRSRAAGK